MKQIYVLAALGLATWSAGAQEVVARVLSATPVVQQVAVPQQVCSQPHMVPPTTGGGGILGAIAGGAIGSQIGSGSGRGAATVLGVIGGAVLGNHIEANAARQGAMPQCTTQTIYENRTVGYNVTYEYAGYEYTAQLPQDPGPTLRLRLTPVALSEPAPPAQPQVMPYPPPIAPYPMAPQAAPVVVAPPVPIGINLGFGYVKHGR